MRVFALSVGLLFVVGVAFAQELPLNSPAGGQTYQKYISENPFKILSFGELKPVKCTKYTTQKEVINLPRKGYHPSYLPYYTTCFVWNAKDEYDEDTLDGKCVRMRYGGLERMREIEKSGSSETILKYGLSHDNKREFGFVYEQDFNRVVQNPSQPWMPVMHVLEYSC